MATLAKNETIIVLFTPEEINRRLAESILVTRGKDFTGMARIKVTYDFGAANKKLRSARVEISR
jgi:hypothetical protein